MKLVTALPGADGADAVSELLRSIRVRSTIWCRSELRAPWGFRTDAHGTAAFHVVTAGQCWLEAEDSDRQLHLVAGDLVLLPTGRRHWVRDDPATPALGLEQLLARHPLDAQRRLRYGGSGARTVLLCGGFALEGWDVHPPGLLRSLPPVIHVQGARGRPVPWVAATLRLLSAEIGSTALGAEAVISRLADVLLAQALRVALAEPDAADGAQLRVLRDPRIATAVQFIHREPQRHWTVGDLASGVALSRSAFAARFREVVGEPPMRYLLRARMAAAARLLRTTDASLAEIAKHTGYESEFTFSKAFKRVVGIAPGAYRSQAEAPAPQPTLSAAGGVALAHDV